MVRRRLGTGKTRDQKTFKLCSGGNVDWAMASARSNTRAEQTHILAAMIQLFPCRTRCFVCSRLHRSDRQLQRIAIWTSMQWINCENRDEMEGIVFMEIKYSAQRHPTRPIFAAGSGFESRKSRERLAHTAVTSPPLRFLFVYV